MKCPVRGLSPAARSPAIVCAYSRLPNVKTWSSYSLAIFSRNPLQCGRRRVCSIGSPRPSWKWNMPCREQAQSGGGSRREGLALRLTCDT